MSLINSWVIYYTDHISVYKFPAKWLVAKNRNYVVLYVVFQGTSGVSSHLNICVRTFKCSSEAFYPMDFVAQKFKIS